MKKSLWPAIFTVVLLLNPLAWVLANDAAQVQNALTALLDGAPATGATMPAFKGRSPNRTPSRVDLPGSAAAQAQEFEQSDQAAPLTVQEIGDDDFENIVVKSEIPVAVYFHDPRSPICRRMYPVVRDLSDEYAGRIRFVQVNTRDHTDVARRLGVDSVPTFVFFKSGRESGDRLHGIVTKEAFKERLNALLR